MASHPSSDLQFCRLDGSRCELREWTPLLLELPGLVGEWTAWKVTINGEQQAISLRSLAGEVRCVCTWPRSGAGRYRITLSHPDHGTSSRELFLPPAKLGQGALGRLVGDLEYRLPYALAAALKRGGALAGMEFRPPAVVSVAAELARLRQLLSGERGLLAVLRQISLDPYRVLVEIAVDVPQDRARRPHPVLLRQAMIRSREIDDEGRPLRLWDLRVEPSCDVYENRLLRLVIEMMRRRLAGLGLVDSLEAQGEVAGLVAALDRARLEATFLDAVARLQTAPTQVTQVLLQRIGYRRLLVLWREIASALEVRLAATELEAPLQSVPDLYELWGSLSSLATIAESLSDRGFQVKRSRLVRRLPEGPMVELVRNQEPVLETAHPDGTVVCVHFQRSFGPNGAVFGSVSLEQRPDLVIETLYPDGTVDLVILDPKYKVDERSSAVRPAKEDIDKMHTYRDAIVHRIHGRVVRHAAILYPGPECDFGAGVSAITADPLHPGTLANAVSGLLEGGG